MADTAELEQKIRTQYPSYVYLLEVPELKQLLLDAVNPDIGFSAEEFQAKFQATGWYRSHGDTQRQWAALVGSDPMTAERQLQAKTAEVYDIVGRMGLPGDWTPELRRSVAIDALQYGFNDAELRDFLVQHVSVVAPERTPIGEMGTIYSEVRRIARSDYLLPLSDQDSWQWAHWISSGSTTIEGFKNAIAETAKGRFPHLADVLDQGVTPGAYFAPYRQLIASEMETTADQVDLMNPKWGEVLSTAGTDGKLRPMTMSEARRYTREQPEWKHTGIAKQEGAGLAKELLTTFGAIA